jgi:hypothetical protein
MTGPHTGPHADLMRTSWVYHLPLIPPLRWSGGPPRRGHEVLMPARGGTKTVEKVRSTAVGSPAPIDDKSFHLSHRRKRGCASGANELAQN